MKLSPETIRVLENFNTINPSILITPGNVLRTQSVTKSIFARVEIPDTFENEFAIYDLGSFLSVLSIFNDPDIRFDDNCCYISEGSSEMRFVFANKNMITYPQGDDLRFPEDVYAEFLLKADELARLSLAFRNMKFKHVNIESDGQKVYLCSANNDNPSTNKYKQYIGESDREFFAVIPSKDLKVFEDKDYHVKVANGIVMFKADNTPDMKYYFATTTDSRF